MADLIERYRKQVDVARQYAAEELRGAPTSTFEIMVGHFASFTDEFEALRSRLAEVEKERDDLRGYEQSWEQTRRAVAELISDVGTMRLRAEAAEARAGRLEKALAEAEETLRLCERPAFPDPVYHEEVKQLGRRIGFGALMSTASAGWREVLIEKEQHPGGEFVSGPCQSTVTSTLRVIRAALTGEKPK